VLHQYDLLLSFGDQNKTNLECCIWFQPDRSSMLRILQQNPSMVMARIGVDAMRGFDEKARYSCFVEIADGKHSVARMPTDKIEVDFNAPPFEWHRINRPEMTQQRRWLHFRCSECIDLQPLPLFCSADVISSGEHQIAVKVFRDSPGDHSPVLVGFLSIPIECDPNRSQRQYTVAVLDPATASTASGKEIDFSVQLLNHENALCFMRFPTPQHEEADEQQIQISLTSDPRHELIEDAGTYPEVINSELFQSIRSQLSFPRKRRGPRDRRTTANGDREQRDNDKKPTQRLFEAIERELTSKQTLIQRLELQQEEQREEMKMVGREMARLREESVTMKRLNQRLSQRLQELMEADKHRFKNLHLLQPEELRAIAVKYANGHSAEKNRRRDLERKNQELVGKLKAAKLIHGKFVRIQAAAQKQAEHIRKLQREQRDLGEYQQTVLSQEEVIEKLEEMLGWAHGTIKALQTKLESGNVVSNRERTQLENEVLALHQENEALRKQIQLNQAGDPKKAATGDLEKLRNELKQEKYKNEGLQQQLKSGAGHFGAQIAGLKIKINKLQSEEFDEDLFLSMGSDGTALELSQVSDAIDSASLLTRDSDI